MFDEAEQRDILKIYNEIKHLLTCPCCGSDKIVLVDIAFEAATGREIKVGDTYQCENCLAYFVPGEDCDQSGSENFTP